MPIGRHRRAGCWLPGLGSPHYTRRGGVGCAVLCCAHMHAGSHREREGEREMSEWFLPNCFSLTLPFFFIATVIFYFIFYFHLIWHVGLNGSYRHIWSILVHVSSSHTLEPDRDTPCAFSARKGQPPRSRARFFCCTTQLIFPIKSSTSSLSRPVKF